MGLLRRVQPHRTGRSVGGVAAGGRRAGLQAREEEAVRLHRRRHHRYESRVWHLPHHESRLRRTPAGSIYSQYKHLEIKSNQVKID